MAGHDPCMPVLRWSVAQTVTLEELLLAAQDAALAGVWAALPGIVQSYNASEQTADIQPAVMNGYTDEAGNRAPETLPVIPRVPVVFPGAGSYSITWPLAVGDTVLLVFSSRSIDTYLSQGGVVDPRDDRRHSLSDAVAIPGLRTYKAPIASATASADALVLAAPSLLLGGADASDPVVRKSDLDAFIQNDFVGHTHGITGIQTGSSALISDGASAVSTPACSSTVMTK